MLQVDKRLSDEVAAAVRRVEARSSAELCVVISGASRRYRDIALLGGLALSWLLLGVVVLSPWSFSPLAALVELPVIGGLATLALTRNRAILARLVPKARQRAAVDAAAAAAFFGEGVHLTRERTGLLVYVSALEQEVRVLPDAGVQSVVPGGDWAHVIWRSEGAGLTRDSLLAGLDAVGEILAQALPTTGDNPNELSDAPRLIDV